MQEQIFPTLERLNERFITREEDLRELAELLRRRGKTIVTTNGCFDLLHTGHLHTLSQARAQGDVLIVGLNSDASVRSYKGPKRPIIPERERAEVLLALDSVDYVALFHEKDCVDFVRRVKPDVHVNDASYGEDCIEAEAVKEGGGRLHLVEKIRVPSTTDIVGTIRNLPAN